MMIVVDKGLVLNKKVLLRLDIDVPIKDGVVIEDFRLKAAVPTLKLCLENGKQVIVMGHIGRPRGEDPELSVAPIYHWLSENGFAGDLESNRLRLFENLRYEKGEQACDMDYAKELASHGEVFINEAFAAHHPAASTIVLPTLLPHWAGLNFAEEVGEVRAVRESPERPLVAIIGGAKLEDKLPVVNTFAKLADAVIVGGKLPAEIRDKGLKFPGNVLIARMDEQGTDLAPEVVDAFTEVILPAKQVVWVGPVGYYEGGCNQGNIGLAEAVIGSGAKSIIGGGDTITALNKLGYLEKFYFISTGGGAMLKLLSEGTLPTIEALK